MLFEQVFANKFKAVLMLMKQFFLLIYMISVRISQVSVGPSHFVGVEGAFSGIICCSVLIAANLLAK